VTSSQRNTWGRKKAHSEESINGNEDSFRWWEGNQTNCFSKGVRKRMKDAHCWTETVYQCPIPTAIFFESLLPFSKKLKDVLGRSNKLKFVGEWIL